MRIGKTPTLLGSGLRLSVVVVVFDMAREAPRTLETLAPGYQGLDPETYEVLVVDNGSPVPLGEDAVQQVAPNFRYIYLEPESPSPVGALNLGATLARGDLLGFMIDGARMLSPGVLRHALDASQLHAQPVVTTLGFHLGPGPQQETTRAGYDQAEEDRLLASVPWREDGYRLFEIAALAPSSWHGVLVPPNESNCVFVRPQTFAAIGGFHPGFDSPGGGLANLDFYREACEAQETQPVLLLGEGSFHQVHGGITTSSDPAEETRAIRARSARYLALRGRPFAPPRVSFQYLGTIPEAFHPVLSHSLSRFPQAIAEDPGQRPPPLLGVRRTEALPGPNRAILVLGMHRSGTSMLAGTLEEAGLDLGEVVTQAPANEKGNRESLVLMRLHEDILERSGGSWDAIPDVVRWSTFHRAVRDLYLTSFATSPAWGFKDPRTLFTLDGWLEALPRAEFVGIFRHPELVARSLQARDGFSLEEGIALWARYNARLLELHRAHGFPLVEFVEDPDDLRRSLRAVVLRLELPRRYAPLRFFEGRLQHHRRAGADLPQEVTELYAELRGRCIEPTEAEPGFDHPAFREVRARRRAGPGARLGAEAGRVWRKLRRILRR